MSNPQDFARRLVAKVGTERARLTLLLEATRTVHDAEGNVTWTQENPAFWLDAAQAVVHMEREVRVQSRRSAFTLSARDAERIEARQEYAASRARMAGYRDTTLLDG